MYRLIVTENRDEYSDIRDKVIFILLPPYSPGLNPIEQVWRITRRENICIVFFDLIDSFESTIDNTFVQWNTHNDQLHTLCS